MDRTIYLILDNVRSMENVGSIFRTADAANIKKIYLCGITPKPPRKEIDKTALGAIDFVEWIYVENINELMKKLKNEKICLIALEQDTRAIQYTQYSKINPSASGQDSNPIALVVGNEVDGVSKDALELADAIIEIPMHGKKNSLNVAVATGITLFELIK